MRCGRVIFRPLLGLFRYIRANSHLGSGAVACLSGRGICGVARTNALFHRLASTVSLRLIRDESGRGRQHLQYRLHGTGLASLGRICFIAGLPLRLALAVGIRSSPFHGLRCGDGNGAFRVSLV